MDGRTGQLDGPTDKNVALPAFGKVATTAQDLPEPTPNQVTPLRAMAETADAATAEVDQQASLLTGRLETSRLGVLIVIEDRTRVAAIERNLSQSRGEVP